MIYPYRRARQGELPEGQEKVPWGTTSARRVNRNANFKTTEYVIGNGCQYHLTQWYSFDAVRRVVAPYGRPLS